MSKGTGVFPEYMWEIYDPSVGVKECGTESSQCPGFPEWHDSLVKDARLVHSSRFFLSVRSSENKMPGAHLPHPPQN